jgi:hypothetical protein
MPSRLHSQHPLPPDEDDDPEPPPDETLLRARDVPHWRKSFKIKVLNIRHTPSDNSLVAILDIEKKFGKSAWALSRIHRRRMTELFGERLELLVGRELSLDVMQHRNAQTGSPVSWLSPSKKQNI